MSARPFYVVAHRCNSTDAVKNAIAEGANAIECDIRYYDSPKYFLVSHDKSVTPEADALIPYLDRMSVVLKAKPSVALVIFDCKDQPENQFLTLLKIVRKHLTDQVPVNVLFSISSYDDRAFFNPLKGFAMAPNEGVGIDEDNNSMRVSAFFQELGISQHTYGNGIYAYGVGPNVPHTVMNAVARRAHGGHLKMVYVWTLQDSDAMRNYMRMGVDGILVNNPATLREVLNEKEFSGNLRLATRTDRPFITPPAPAYVLDVKTADVGGGGTDAWLRFAVVGPDEQMLHYIIDSCPPKLFESGDTNSVTIFGDVGAPKKVRVWRDDSGNGPGWYLDRITLTKTKGTTPAVGAKTIIFDQWIPASEVIVKPVP